MFGIRTRQARRAERVSRGMSVLDAAKPGWHQRIDLDALDISDGKVCALGQVYGLYGWGCNRLGLSRRDTPRMGFQIDYTKIPVIGVRPEYKRLTAEWRRQIETRLDAEREQWAQDMKVGGRRR